VTNEELRWRVIEKFREETILRHQQVDCEERRDHAGAADCYRRRLLALRQAGALIEAMR
jgi:hypothetical protein